MVAWMGHGSMLHERDDGWASVQAIYEARCLQEQACWHVPCGAPPLDAMTGCDSLQIAKYAVHV